MKRVNDHFKEIWPGASFAATPEGALGRFKQIRRSVVCRLFRCSRFSDGGGVCDVFVHGMVAPFVSRGIDGTQTFDLGQWWRVIVAFESSDHAVVQALQCASVPWRHLCVHW